MLMNRTLVLFLLLCSHIAWATPELRHTTGIQSVALTGGQTATGYCASGAYSAYLNQHWYWKLSLGGTYQRQASYQSFQCMPAVGVNLIQGNKAFYINLLLGAAAAYERHQQRGNTYEGWNIVLHAGPEIALYLSNHLVLLASLLPSYYCLENPYGHWGYEGTLGFAITF